MTGDNRTTEFAVLQPGVSQRLADSAGVSDIVCHAQEGTTGTVLFDASARTAPAQQPVGDNSEMPELCARTETTAKELAVGHDCSANSGTDSQHGHVVHTATGSEPKLRPSRCIRIVVDCYIDSDSFQQTLTKRLVTPLDVGGVMDL
jgi:hypothetical protein